MSSAGGVTIYAACSPGEVRAAAMRGGVLVDYAVHRAGAPDGVGDRLRGRVLTHVAGMAGAFVGLPGGVEGFLPDSQGGAGLGVGDAVTVVVTRAAMGGKGPRLSARVEQEGAGAPALLAAGPGAIGRLQALHPGAAVVVDDAAAAVPGAVVVARAWDEAVETEVEELGGTVVELRGGVRASIWPTPALVAIDMDAAPVGGRSKAAGQLEANRAALPGLARAIRLRNLSGGIVVDLAGMAVKARASLGGALVEALVGDPLRPRFLGFSALGLAEVLRPRVYPPLHELLAGPHAAGLAALRALVRADVAAAHVVYAAPDVVRALQEDGCAQADVLRRTGRALTVRSEPGLLPGRWRVEALSRGRD